MTRLFSIFWSLLNVRLFMVEREHKCPFVRWLKSNITTPTVYLFIPFKPMRAVIRRLNVGNYPSCSALLTPVLGDTFTCWDSCGVWLCNIQGGKKKNDHWHQTSVSGDKWTHRAWGAVVLFSNTVQHYVFNEHSDGLQDKRYEEMHVDEVPRAVELPEHEHTTHVDSN